MKVDLVAEGGSVKIGGLVGAAKALVDSGFTFSHLAGSSSGAIVCSLLAAGYTPHELEDIILGTNFEDFLDGGKILAPVNFIRHLGMYKGDKFYFFIRELLAAKNVHTFKDLIYRHDDNKEELNSMYRWKLKVIITDITLGKMVIVPDELSNYGQQPDNFEVAMAIRMSMSLPVYFRPIKKWGSFFVDGGATSNFPIWIFDAENDFLLTHPTFGLYLDESKTTVSLNEISGWWSFLRATVNTALQARDSRFISPGDFTYRTIKIPTGKIKTTDFSLSRYMKEWIINSGYKSTIRFLETWNWEKYKEWRLENMK